MRRRWPAQRFIELTKGILDKTDCDIVITGNNVAEEAIDEYVAAFRGCSRVSIQIKKLKLSEWVELIRGARFFIGVDSGGVHVAAAVGTQAFCLTGAWDGHRFYPYPLEERTNKHSIEPICICRNDVDRNELPCAGCCSKGGYGYGNPKCRARCKRGETCQCLLKIMPDDVLTALHDAHALDPVNCE